MYYYFRTIWISMYQCQYIKRLELWKNQKRAAKSVYTCKECANGLYTLDSTICKICPPKLICENNKITVKQNHHVSQEESTDKTKGLESTDKTKGLGMFIVYCVQIYKYINIYIHFRVLL